MEYLLVASDITKEFHDAPASLKVLDSVSLKAAAGEIVCILGASGAGKTTLLNILSGIDIPTSGHIESSVLRPGKEIGYMRQNDDLLPWRTVEKNISLGLELLQFPNDKINEYTDYWLKKTELNEYRNFFPHQISGGMKQRTALARCLALMPKILFMDEPLGSLDIVGRRKMAEYIKKYVREEKATAIVVTHSVEEAVFLADKIFIMSPRPMSVAAEIFIHDPDDTEKKGLLRSDAFDTVSATLFSVSREKDVCHA